MASQPNFFYNDRGQELGPQPQENRELALRWKFVQQHVGKPITPGTLPPLLTVTPPAQGPAPQADQSQSMYSIVAELKAAYHNGECALNGRSRCQQELARQLRERWDYLHDHVDPAQLVEASHEIVYLQDIITRERYTLSCDRHNQARAAEKNYVERMARLEAQMTSYHHDLSRQFRVWRERNSGQVIVPFQPTDEVNTDSVWHDWFRLEQQAVKAQIATGIWRRVDYWLFPDMLATMTNTLIDRGEM